MKLLPSPSCSSSSSFSTSTFDAHGCNPRAALATPSCLSGILRRILCSGTLPTHPTDQITDDTSSVNSDEKLLQVKDLNVKPTSGIVARLMGLDPLPEMKQNHNSIARSQSMNSVGHFYKHLEGKHQRVRSTQSFQEIPTFLELENEEYFILSFEGEIKSKEFSAKQRSQRIRKTKKKRFDPEEAKQFILIDSKEKKKSTRKVESECSSDELSPISVLDSSKFLIDPEESAPLLSGNAASNSPIYPESKIAKTKVVEYEIQRERFEEEIRKITEMDLGESNWKCSEICEEHEELEAGGIIEGFDWYILEGLIDEFVEQMYD
ncbi:uncharacterized protein LOC111469543 [Cucurbita maxima]|uniref:Uncharacterized protein LOC111469543 n=1 Tax=Cucurbita maxima TaxID=3661 RepID=A0A6J1I3B7_CUCMA|nr:uncharacterized protein LOC111469543 [Cucurbita maxima]